jgi:protein-ribulosamine 3-kinase
MPFASLERVLKKELSSSFEIRNITSVGGGSISNCYRIETGSGIYFLKTNDASFAADMFEKELLGLQLLHKAGVIHVPDIICRGKTDDYDFLLLEYIDRAIASENSWQLAGAQLALLHRIYADVFGLAHDNYIGSLPQSNKQHKNFHDFFIYERLEPQVRLAEKKGYLNCTATDYFESLYVKLPSRLPDEMPSLLHGDLWSGNIMFTAKGTPVIFDPAVHYGNRESEIAFTKLFGGFDDIFYRSYQHEYPLQHGFGERVDIYNLYPLLVHLNIFGAGYLSDVMSIVKRYS